MAPVMPEGGGGNSQFGSFSKIYTTKVSKIKIPNLNIRLFRNTENGRGYVVHNYRISPLIYTKHIRMHIQKYIK